MDDINATMSEITRRIAELEHATPGRGESNFLRVGAVAGVLGTIISIAVGILGVWQARTEEQEARYAKFSAPINDINRYNEKIINNLSNVPLTQVFLAERYLAISEANQIYPTIKTNATAPQLAIMASQTALLGDSEQSEQYMKSALAIEEKHSNPVALAELFRVNATTFQTISRKTQLSSINAGIEAGAPMTASWELVNYSVVLKYFSFAFSLVSKGSSGPIFKERAQILRDWTQAAAQDLDCSVAQDKFNEYSTALSDISEPPNIQDAWKEELRSWAAQNSPCKLTLPPSR